ncbi:otoraplin-like [Polypterus senegalus]|uniref:otoraplin-like n=1 Tax=Polypterus senegalus TaxID=55291 RepID=UPI0019632E1A|nr:otoraplin-like [Polypterus senegalus]
MQHTMAQLLGSLFLVGILFQATSGIFMEKLSSKKLCADEECAYTISLAQAKEDFTAPDCRFINFKSDQLIYVYAKLLPDEGAGEYWLGSVYSDRLVEQMGVIGFFPSNLVMETNVFKKENVEIPTTDIDFFCD